MARAVTIDYDARARDWLAGRLEPSIGRDAWQAKARADAEHAARILAPYNPRTLVEVGSGIARLTPHLADRFDHVIAIDTSPGMQECTTLACEGLANVSVREHRLGEPYPVGDAALVWDVLEDDWTLQQADDLIAGIQRSCLLVLVQSTRLKEWSPWQPQILREGTNWWLLASDAL